MNSSLWKQRQITCSHHTQSGILQSVRYQTTSLHDQEIFVQVGKVLANGPGDLGSIPGRVIPKTLKMVLDTSLLNTQQYKVRIKGKEEQSRERSNTLPWIPL